MSQSNPKSPAIRQSYYLDGHVDFDELATHDAEFAARFRDGKNNRWINFHDPEVVQQLTRSLLKYDFNLTIKLPGDRLCPPVPVRWNYVRWIQELLDSTNPSLATSDNESIQPVIGLDIGVGASCIYGLLACASRSTWRMKGTDIDPVSLTHARANVERNGLQDRITLSHSASSDDPLISLADGELLNFVMTNPPFYESIVDMQASYTDKSAPASAICTGSENEMICPGGDLGFVSRILAESLVLRERVRWYTAMFGKLSSLYIFVHELRKNSIGNFAITPLHAGQRTKRWAVGWSFGAWRPRGDLTRHPEVVQALLPSATAWSTHLPLVSAQWTGRKVDDLVKGFDVSWEWDEERMTGIMEAQGNMWSRAAKRRAKFQSTRPRDEDQDKDERGSKRPRLDDSKTEQSSRKVSSYADSMAPGRLESPSIALAVRIVCKNETIDISWLRGQDPVLFQSFCAIIRRAFTNQP